MTEVVFDAIRRAKPSRLYVAADGPRESRSGEGEQVEQTRTIATRIDWHCDIKTLFRDENIGCRRAVSEALDWFFDHEVSGIVLEDDCVPGQSFFWYCQELLERYKTDDRIAVISGNNFQRGWRRSDDSYYFSRYNHCWGWATWRRAWQTYDRDLSLWPQFKQRHYLRDISGNDHLFERYWTTIFDRSYRNAVDSWAYRWTFTCWAHGGLTCVPSVNLVTNIGFGSESTHTSKGDGHLDTLPLNDLSFPLIHPLFVVRDWQADLNTDRNVFRISRFFLMRNSLKDAVLGSRFAGPIHQWLRRRLST